ncbi:MAG: glycoside hydrolase family 20 zincin-like fold domain-containing protein, partial [Phycisphaerae bacterium]
MDNLFLLPQPRKLKRRAGVLAIPHGVDFAAADGLEASFDPLVRAARRALGMRRPRTGAPLATLIRSDRPLLTFELKAPGFRTAGAYRLIVNQREIRAQAGDAAGLWNAVQTLAQLARVRSGAIPCAEIEDWPDLPIRGVLLDVSRDKVPKLHTLYELVDWLSGMKINQLQLYTEHTFAYRRHRTVWTDASPMTPADIQALDQYCADRFVDLVPNQNCFGHMERWLRHDRYAPLAEATEPWRDPWGRIREQPTTLNPLDPRSFQLVAGLLDDLLPNFRSGLVNVNCDEPFELGQGRSAAACGRRGLAAVYLDFLLKLNRHVRRRKRKMMFWADVVQAHPEVIAKLPADAIALEWGYEADHPFDQRCARLARARRPFYVCPGTSSWCSFSGRTDNALDNLRAAAQAGIRHGAAGFLI